MLTKYTLNVLFTITILAVVFVLAQCTAPQEKKMTKKEMIKRGAYLLNFGGCNDCHSPKVFTDMGPIPDTTKLLSGFQAGSEIPKVDTMSIRPGKWYLSSPDLTVWVGPWGMSYSANLTPDINTGIGGWNEQMFVNAMRNGLHLGAGRPLLPPMPFMGLAGLKDEDLKSVFEYLMSIKPINNKVPNPISLNEVVSRYGK